MSSTYRFVCLSHTPPLVVDGIEYGTDGRKDIVRRLLDDPDVADHRGCDLAVARWSGGLCEATARGVFGWRNVPPVDDPLSLLPVLLGRTEPVGVTTLWLCAGFTEAGRGAVDDARPRLEAAGYLTRSPDESATAVADLRSMLACDGLVPLADWGRDKARILEREVAGRVGIPVKTLREWVLDGEADEENTAEGAKTNRVLASATEWDLAALSGSTTDLEGRLSTVEEILGRLLRASL